MMPLRMGVLAREEARPARGTERSRGEGVQEAHALAREPVDVRRLDERVTGCPKLVPAQVVDEHDNHVGPSGPLVGLAARAGREHNSQKGGGCREMPECHVPRSITNRPMTYASIQSAGSWRPLRHCPGRSIWEGASDRRPSDLVGAVVAVRVFRVPTAADPVHVAPLDEGGLISYEKADGRFVHTLNTPEGFARKLEQLGIRLEGDRP